MVRTTSGQKSGPRQMFANTIPT